MARALTGPRGQADARQRSDPAPPSRGKSRGLRHSLWLWIPLGLLCAVSAYALLGFKVAPRVVRWAATKYVQDEYGRELSLGEIKVHPFKLHLELNDVLFPDRDRKRLFSFDRVFVDFQVFASIWKRSFTFHEISLERPEVRAIIRPNGQLNFIDLKGKPDPEASPDDKLPRVWIEYLTVAHGKLDFIDRARRRPFEQVLSPLNFTLKDFRTTPEGGDFQFAATAADNSKLAWRGNFALEPDASSRGDVVLHGFPAATVAEYLGDSLPFAVPKGKINLRASYQTTLGKKVRARMSLSNTRLTDVQLRARGEKASWVTLPEIDISDVVATYEKQDVQVAKIVVKKPRLQARLEEGGKLNLMRLFSQPTSLAEGKQPVGGRRAKTAKASSGEWAVKLSHVEVVQGHVDVEDAAYAPGTRFALSPVNVSAKEVTLDLKRPVPVDVELAINEDDGQIRLGGTVTPQPFGAELDVVVEDAALGLAQPYVAQQAALTIREGDVGAKGKLTLREADGAAPSLSFQGDVTFANFKSTDDALNQDFVNFKGLDLKQVKYTEGPDALEIQRIVAKQPYARVVLSEKQVLNLSEVLSPDAPKTVAGTPPRDLASSGSTEGGARPPQTEVSKQEAMPIKIGTVFVNDMRLNFSDFYVKPNFSAEIHGLTGKLKGLSTDPKSRANVHLEGNLGENSPVTISGKTQPFAYDKFSDISIKCENIALPVFNPYSGRFAGYNIARGELSTDLHYVVKNRKLDAEHHIRIDQLSWGDKTETKEKAPFPVKLATALLRDREGVIKLDVPVNGTLDDPKFRVWPIVWQVVKNIIVKAVTAPFDLLGSLFKGAEKARYVEFAPGKAVLDQNAKTGLASLSKALLERPKLTLDVPVGTAGELDKEALADQKFKQGLQASAGETLSRRAKRSGVPPFEKLDDGQKKEALEKLYENLTGDKPEVRDAKEAPKGTSRRAAKESKRLNELEQLTRMTREKIQVEQSELDALGKKRGEAIEAELLKGEKLEASRVLLSKSGKVSGEKGKVRYELGFQ